MKKKMSFSTAKRVLVNYFKIDDDVKIFRLRNWKSLKKLIESNTDFNCTEGLHGCKDIERFVLTQTDYKYKPFLHLVKDGIPCANPIKKEKPQRLKVIPSHKDLRAKNIEYEKRIKEQRRIKEMEEAQKRGIIQTPMVILRKKRKND